MRPLLFIQVLFSSIISLAVNEPSLRVFGVNSTPIVYTQSQLMKSAKLVKVIISHDPAYGKKIEYWAVPFRTLIEGHSINADATIQFKCLDGYSSNLDAQQLIHAEEAHQAYVAILPVNDDKWTLNLNKKEVGPFYLVWPSPKDGKFIEANWPFNLDSFTIINKSFSQQFPKVVPIQSELLNDKIQNGFRLFRETCFACHTLNGQGSAKMGPDLNSPSFVKLLGGETVKQVVRDPKKFVPNGNMSALPKDVLSDEDLDSIIAYLTYMDEHR